MATLGDNSVVELEFRFTDLDHPFVGLTEQTGTRLVLEDVVPRDASHYSEFFTVEGADIETLVDAVEPVEGVEANALSYEDGDRLLELYVTDYCPIMALAQQGAFLQYADSDNGEVTIVVEVPPQLDAGRITEDFLEKYAESELVRRRTLSSSAPTYGLREFDEAVSDLLTPRQKEALYTAFEHDYFEWPRGTDGQDLADELDVSAPTFHQHLRAAERKVISLLYDCQEGARARPRHEDAASEPASTAHPSLSE